MSTVVQNRLRLLGWRDVATAFALGTAFTASHLIGLKHTMGENALVFFAGRFLQLWPWIVVSVGAMVAGVALCHRFLLPSPRWPRSRQSVLVLIWLGLTLLIFSLSLALEGRLGAVRLPTLYWFQCVAMLTGALLMVREYGSRSQAGRNRLDVAEVEREGLRKELVEAQQQLLRAQVEPHFLFNSLANLRRLVRTDPEAASAMLNDLLRYLQEALPRLRDETSILAGELELARAYLAVHQVRMGERLQVEVDVADELAACTVPSMSLLTLAENAIKHGLQPSVSGGSIRISASDEGETLCLCVADTGKGMSSGLGHGTGLANLRARLRAAYGDRASLSLQVNEPCGVVACIRLPKRP